MANLIEAKRIEKQDRLIEIKRMKYRECNNDHEINTTKINKKLKMKHSIISMNYYDLKNNIITYANIIYISYDIRGKDDERIKQYINFTFDKPITLLMVLKKMKNIKFYGEFIETPYRSIENNNVFHIPSYN